MRLLSPAALARAAAAAVLALSAPALANGRYPSADQLLVDPADPSHLFLRATFGLLDSRDAGKTWHWICEGAVGYGSAEDPSLAITADGSIISGSFEGLAVTHDKDCSWASPPGDIFGRYSVDITIDRAQPSNALVVTGGDLDGGYNVLVLATSDNGAHFAPLGIPVGSDFTPVTIDVAPSMPDRIYLSGSTPVSTVIERSDNRGLAWQAFPITPYSDKGAYIAAIDPNDAQKVYLRVEDAPADHLLLSTNSGQTWNEIFSFTGDMLGFALSPDGTRIAAGGPEGGLYAASTSDYKFTKTAAPVRNLRCLTWTQAGLYACSKETVDGWTVALSADEGQSFAPLMHLADVSPLACGAQTSVGMECARAWPAVERLIASTLDGGTDAQAPADDASLEDVEAPEAGAPNEPDVSAADAPLPPETGTVPPEDAPSGCSCRVGHKADSPLAALLCIALGITTWLGRPFGCKRSRWRASTHCSRRSCAVSIPTATS
jgi:hypothetical protein